MVQTSAMDHGRPCANRGQPVGQYANSFKVGYNAFEFVIEFGQLHAGGDPEKVHTRIVTAPEYAKTLASLLAKSIARHQKTFGLIGKVARRSRRPVSG